MRGDLGFIFIFILILIFTLIFTPIFVLIFILILVLVLVLILVFTLVFLWFFFGFHFTICSALLRSLTLLARSCCSHLSIVSDNPRTRGGQTTKTRQLVNLGSNID